MERKSSQVPSSGAASFKFDMKRTSMNIHDLASCPILNYLSHEGQMLRMARVTAAFKAPAPKQRSDAFMQKIPQTLLNSMGFRRTEKPIPFDPTQGSRNADTAVMTEDELGSPALSV